MKTKRFKFILLLTVFLLLIPLIAMQITDEVNWTPLDFIAAAFLLISTSLIIDFTLRKTKKLSYRILISITVLIILLIIWAELAVGIFGSPLAGN
jgi:hypothetical protein